MAKFAFDHPDDAVQALAQRLQPVTDTEVDSGDFLGRVLASSVTADRDSPAADVSAMDGYAIRLSNLSQDEVKVSGQSVPGSPPPTMAEGTVIRIFTGAIVPPECEAVVKREETEELENSIRFRADAHRISSGENIRRAGENAAAESNVVPRGSLVSPATIATMANFGCRSIDVLRRVRVSILTTGDEVGEFEDEAPQPWQLRNSNRAALAALIQQYPWLQLARCDHCGDDQQALTEKLSESLSDSDAVLLTGGVSMGDYDYVPDVIKSLEASIVFHGLPIRPGKPILGAASKSGKLIMGLPGNPVSSIVGCRRMGLPLLRKLSGQIEWQPKAATVTLINPSTKTIPLHWMKLVRLDGNGIASEIASMGSGDLVSLGKSTGFVEVAKNESGSGPWPYHAW